MFKKLSTSLASTSSALRAMVLQVKYISAMTPAVAQLQPYRGCHMRPSLAIPFSLVIFRMFRNHKHEDANPWSIASKESNLDAG